MSTVQKDLKNSTYESNPDGEEPTSPAAPRPLVSDECGSPNHKHADANFNWLAQGNAEAEAEADDASVVGGEDNDKNANYRSETGAPGQENHGNRANPSHNDGVEPEATPIRCDVNTERKYDQPKVELYQAALKGDWKSAKSIFDSNSSSITMPISCADDTALHIAAAAKHISFVEELVKLSDSSDLAIRNKNGYTALTFAALSGVVRIAEVMVDKNSQLSNELVPVLMAVAYKRRDMASFLYSKTKFEDLRPSKLIELLTTAISSDYYDIALDILKKKPELATERDTNGNTALHVLARKPSTIGSSSELSFWKRSINSCNTSTLLSFGYGFDGIYYEALMQTLAHQIVESLWNFVLKKLTKDELHEFVNNPSSLLLDAAAVGNAEFLIILLRSHPDLMWVRDEDENSIFHIAVQNRQENVFSLIYEIGGLKDLLANEFNEKKKFNMLHLAGSLPPPEHLTRVSGAALLMQRELLWFKEVEKVVESRLHEMRCSLVTELSEVMITKDPVDNLTPRELFTKEHEQLRKHGEQWMKNTANSCMLVATLIATVVFAAAFTVPGGNDDKEGIPIFRKNKAFTVFVISNAAALVLSTTSILTFLSILTSRYAEEDFLVSLTSKLLFGLLTLFVSIVCMVVAFSATFFIAYDKTKVKIPLAIAAVAILPVGCFCVFHSRLVVDILWSIYWSKFSFRQRKKRLF